MDKEVYAVYHASQDGSMWDEANRFYSLDKAKKFANALHDRTKRNVRIDWVLWRIDRDGREVLDSLSDIYSLFVSPVAAERQSGFDSRLAKAKQQLAEEQNDMQRWRNDAG